MKKYPLSFIISLAICVLSLAPIGRVEIAQDVPLADKWVHFVMYGTLTAVMWWEMVRHKCSLCALLGWGVLYCALLGGLMELAQAYLTTYRSGDWWDFVADCIGVLIGALLGVAYRLFRHSL